MTQRYDIPPFTAWLQNYLVSLPDQALLHPGTKPYFRIPVLVEQYFEKLLR